MNMRLRDLAAAAALGLAALGLLGCATGLNTQVSRFQPAAIPAGASFYVVPKHGEADPRFYRYASMVSQQLTAQGFRPAGTPQAADILVKVDYGIDQGHTEVYSDPFYGGYGFGRFGFGDPFFRHSFWGGGPFFSAWGGSPFYYGWDDPFGYGLSSYTVFRSYLDMDIVRRVDEAPLFEGHAKARSQTDELDRLVPDLVTAMFTGFPGRNGETVRITIPAKRS